MDEVLKNQLNTIAVNLNSVSTSMRNGNGNAGQQIQIIEEEVAKIQTLTGMRKEKELEKKEEEDGGVNGPGPINPPE